MNHVILIGFMGCGKSSVGKALAEALLVPFVDTDELIERRDGRLIRDIFRESGEDFFRDLETETLALLLESNERMVIAAGEGFPCARKTGNISGSLALQSTSWQRRRHWWRVCGRMIPDPCFREGSWRKR